MSDKTASGLPLNLVEIRVRGDIYHEELSSRPNLAGPGERAAAVVHRGALLWYAYRNGGAHRGQTSVGELCSRVSRDTREDLPLHLGFCVRSVQCTFLSNSNWIRVQ